MICDLAETYHIFNYRELSPYLVATLVVGLKDNSRVKLKLSNSKVDSLHIMLAGILDSLNNLVWLNSSDGQKGENRPKSLVAELLGTSNDSGVATFESVEEFEEEMKKYERR